MPRFDRCIEDVLDFFDEYASEETECLSRDQFKELATSTFSSPEYEGKLGSIDVDELFDKLDTNSDGELTFEEYIRCIVEIIERFRKKAGRKGGKNRRQENADVPSISDCVEDIIEFFETNSSEGSDGLSRDQFKELATSQINSSSFAGKLEGDKLDELFDELDSNSDGELSFKEYIKCLGTILKTMRKKTGRRGKRGGRGGRGGGGRGGGGGGRGGGGRGGRGGKGDKGGD
ncbi:uncharacterized protein LOC144199043 [Stigmatopora nigra]